MKKDRKRIEEGENSVRAGITCRWMQLLLPEGEEERLLLLLLLVLLLPNQ